jgi:hypothetical protein
LVLSFCSNAQRLFLIAILSMAEQQALYQSLCSSYFICITAVQQ